MMKLIGWWNGGYDEEIIAVFENAEFLNEYLKENHIFLGSDNFGEDGYEVELSDGTRVYEVD